MKELGIQCAIPVAIGSVFKVASRKIGRFENLKGFNLIRI